MILKPAHGLLRRLRAYFVFIATATTVFYLWRAGFFSNHRISDFDGTLADPIRQALRDGHAAVAPTSVFSKNFCRSHGWRVFQPSSSSPEGATRRKVFDLSMVNAELDWLEIRLNTTYNYVDYFVLVEASQTFTGLDKPLVIKQNLDRLAPYKDKIIYHELEYPPDFHPKRTWDREDLQRDAMYDQVLPRLTGPQRPNRGDVIVVADVDEIPRPETLVVLRHCDFPRRLTLRSRFYYYSFQFRHRGPEWKHPQATFYDGDRTVRPVNLRNGDGGLAPLIWWEKGDLWNAGWHCSSCFASIEGFLGKLSSFSHVLMNQDFFRDRDRIADSVRNGKDLWNRKEETFYRIDNNTDIPVFLLENPDRFRYLLNRDGETAGFVDYPP